MLVDSHCHLSYDKPEWGGLEALLERAQAHDVQALLNIGCAREDFVKVQEAAEKYEPVFFSVGVHPHEAAPTLASCSQEHLLQEMRAFLAHPKALALGETGLDFYYEHSPQKEQRALFKAHIELALDLDIPLIVHTREAEKGTIELLQEVGQGQVRGVIHCFSGSRWLMEESLKLGFYISASGIVTFKKAEDLRHIFADVPLERLLVETDAPYLAPVPHRGKVNEPCFVVETAKVLADLKGVSFEVLAQRTTDNFKKLFSRFALSS